MRTLTNRIAALSLCFAVGTAGALVPPCKTRVDLVGPCFTVRGSLRLFNGTPSARIMVSGSKRVLGVKPLYEADNETFVAPDWIRAKADFDKGFRASFLVCPLAKQEPHRMQEVCIESGRTK